MTITTRVNTCNHYYVTVCNTKEERYTPYESFYWNDSPAFHRGELGGGIARSVKCDDSLATMVIDEDQQDNMPKQQGGGGYNQAYKIESTM